MDSKFSAIVLIGLLYAISQVLGATETYVGAVAEYSPVTTGITEKDIVLKNVANYEKFIKEASQKGADIIVFPEFGLRAKTYLSSIPDPADKIRPWDPRSKFGTSEVVIRLSDAAKKYQIYTVVNLPEKYYCRHEKYCTNIGYHKYITNVVFDRNGTVIARYRKYNMYYDFGTGVTKEPEISFFDTDFNVRFGTFTFFDILFYNPTSKLLEKHGITDFVVPCQWFNELPFLTGIPAVQAQAGWAESNDVNLLVSGYNNPETGNFGSGIYNGQYGTLANVLEGKKTSKLLIARIPKIRKERGEKKNYNSKRRPSPSFVYTILLNNSVENDVAKQYRLTFLKDEMKLYNSKNITPGEVFNEKLCQGEFCCNFNVDMDWADRSLEISKFYYRAVAFNGVRRFGRRSTGRVQSCGVILCDGPKIINCANRPKEISIVYNFFNISIRGEFSLEKSFQMASTLTYGNGISTIPPFQYGFGIEDSKFIKKVSLELQRTIYDLHTFAIWGRSF